MYAINFTFASLVLSFQVYLAQTIFKLLMVTLIMSYTVPFLGSLSFSHVCQPAEQTLVGYTTFECVHSLSSLLRKLLVTYLILLGIYALLNFYTLSWSFRRLGLASIFILLFFEVKYR